MMLLQYQVLNRQFKALTPGHPCVINCFDAVWARGPLGGQEGLKDARDENVQLLNKLSMDMCFYA